MNVEINNLCFSYGAHEVLRDVSFTAREGEVTALLGPNGVGKSTLFHCVLGLLRGYEGSIRIGGADVRDMPARALAKLAAHIPQNHRVVFHYSVLDMVLMGTAHQVGVFAAPGSPQAERALWALEEAGIARLAQNSFLKLSGGEQQLVLVARALAQQARVLLMDEPTSNLDFGNQMRVLEIVRRLAETGYTVILSSHNPQHVLHFADGIVALHGGEVIARGTPGEVMDEALLRRLYGVDVRFVATEHGRVIAPTPGGGR